MASLVVSLLFTLVTFYVIKTYFSGTKNPLQSDLSNKLIIITGSSSGLGLESAKNLLSLNSIVIFACRNISKAKESIFSFSKNIKFQKKNAHFIELDLCSFDSIKNFVKIVKKNFPEKIDILINNAGALPYNFYITKDGLESFIQGNHLGPMLLTFLLIDHFKPKGKIINVSSFSYRFSYLGGHENFLKILSDNDLIKEIYFSSFLGKFLLYFDTKLMNIYFTNFLNDIMTKKNLEIKACSVNPGLCRTDFFNNLKHFGLLWYLYKLFYPLIWIIFKSPKEGIQTIIFLTMLNWDLVKGGGYYNDCIQQKMGKKGESIRLRNSIIRWSIEELKKRKEVTFIN